MKKINLFLALLTLVLCSCNNNDVILQNNFVAIESVQAINDSTYNVNLKCGTNGKVISTASFTTDFRYQAGDTMWSEGQLKKHYENSAIQLKAENQALKDSVFFYKVNLGNQIEDLNKTIKDLQIQNSALQNALVKLK